jgi:hypothetical protein
MAKYETTKTSGTTGKTTVVRTTGSGEAARKTADQRNANRALGSSDSYGVREAR